MIPNLFLTVEKARQNKTYRVFGLAAQLVLPLPFALLLLGKTVMFVLVDFLFARYVVLVYWFGRADVRSSLSALHKTLLLGIAREQQGCSRAYEKARLCKR